MTQLVDIDLESAVIAFRPAAGTERSRPFSEASTSDLLNALPWRTFRWYFGQRHYSGTYWSSTTRDHVIYESLLELSNLLFADYDSSVRQIVAQPFLVSVSFDGTVRRHIPDYLWGTAEGAVLVDVVREERLTHPRIAVMCEWTRRIAESHGWRYRVLSERDPVELANVRFLAGYRREWLINASALEALRAEISSFEGATIAEVERRFTDTPKGSLRSALLHMMWRQEVSVNLAAPLQSSTVLAVPP